MYELYRQDLRTWFYVDRLSATELQDKYVQEHGAFVGRANLTRWRVRLPDQQILRALALTCPGAL